MGTKSRTFMSMRAAKLKSRQIWIAACVTLCACPLNTLTDHFPCEEDEDCSPTYGSCEHGFCNGPPPDPKWCNPGKYECDEGDGCYPISEHEDDQRGFGCFPVPFSPLGIGVLCEPDTLNACESGLVCSTGSLTVNGPEVCRPYCRESSDCKDLDYARCFGFYDEQSGIRLPVVTESPEPLSAIVGICVKEVCGDDRLEGFEECEGGGVCNENCLLPGEFIHVPFDESIGDSGNTNWISVTLNGSPEYVDGILGSGVRFDGAQGEYGEIENLTRMLDADGLYDGPLSISFWFKEDDALHKSLFNFRNGYGGISMERGSNHISFVYSEASGSHYAAFNLPLEVGQWHHAAIICDRTAGFEPCTIRIYVDGMLAGDEQPSYPVFTSVQPQNALLGVGPGAVTFDEFRVYRRAFRDIGAICVELLRGVFSDGQCRFPDME